MNNLNLPDPKLMDVAVPNNLKLGIDLDKQKVNSGIEPELKRLVSKEIINNKINYFVKSKTERKNVPNFLVEINDDKIEDKNLLKGLYLVGDYMDKNILKPNNINSPSPRIDFVNLLK